MLLLSLALLLLLLAAAAAVKAASPNLLAGTAPPPAYGSGGNTHSGVRISGSISSSDADAAAARPSVLGQNGCVVQGVAAASCLGFNATDSTAILQAALDLPTIQTLVIDLPPTCDAVRGVNCAWVVRPPASCHTLPASGSIREIDRSCGMHAY